jgi:outer membrane protein assembly factor BamB
MWCLNARSGEPVWGPERLTVETYSSSPVLADGKIYATSENGVTTVVRAGREFEILARNELSGFTLASPAISDGQIFLRTAEYLYAIGERRSGG